VPTFFFYRWTFSPDHYFFADHWSHMWFAAFGPGWKTELSNVWNAAWPYTRPVGSLALGTLYRSFGFDPLPFHVAFFCVHVVNIFLVFRFASAFFRSSVYGMAAAFLFGNYFVATLAAVTWTGAVFDLLCNLFVLLAITSYLSPSRAIRFCSVLFYLLALRTKQMALPLPLILILFDWCSTGAPITRKYLWATAKRFWLHILILLGATASGIYGVFYSARALPSTDPYVMTFGVRVFLVDLTFYVKALVYMQDGYVIRVAATLMGGLLAGLWFGRRRLVFAIGSFVLSLLPVIFIPAQRNTLYLYIPVVFFSILAIETVSIVSELILKAARPILRRERPVVAAVLSFLLSAGAVVLVVSAGTPYLHSYEVFEHRLGKMNREGIAFLRNTFPKLPAHTKLFVAGVPAYESVFEYNSGMGIQALYRDKTIQVIARGTDAAMKRSFAEAAEPKFFVEYSDGKYRDITSDLRTAPGRL
jgi:hypothetical protein